MGWAGFIILVTLSVAASFEFFLRSAHIIEITVRGIDIRKRVVTKQAVFYGQDRCRGLQVLEHHAVMANAKSKQHIEIHFGVIHDQGLQDRVAHGFRIIRA